MGRAERAMVVRAQASTDQRHGHDPHERPMEELLRVGVVNLDKPQGPTSHQVVSWLKDALEVGKAGHGGTLDPNVTGVLPVALLDATRVVGTLLEAGKEYVTVMELHDEVPEYRVMEVLREFTGPIYQVPPLKSAVKRQLRVREIYELEVLEAQPRHVLFRVACEAGTYVRSLCHDVGRVLGVGGHMRDLRRTRSGPLAEGDCVNLHDVRDAYVFWKEEGMEEPLREVVRPVEELLEPFPRVVVRDSAVDALCHGADLAVPGVLEVERGVEPGDTVVVNSLKGEAVALAEAALRDEAMVLEEHGVAARTSRVLMEPGTYPRGW